MYWYNWHRQFLELFQLRTHCIRNSIMKRFEPLQNTYFLMHCVKKQNAFNEKEGNIISVRGKYKLSIRTFTPVKYVHNCMKREFVLNLTLLIAVNALVKPIYIFGIDRNIQNLVGSDSYGVYYALLNFTYLGVVINDLGIQNFNAREIAMHPQLFNKLFNRIISLKLVLLVAFFVLISVAMFVFYPQNYWHLIFLLALCQSVLSLNFYLRSCLTGLGFYRFDSIISSADRFFLIFICGAFLYVPALQKYFGIEQFVYAQIFTQSLTALIIILKLRSKIFSFQFNFKWQNAWLILKQSFPFSLSVILMSLYTKTDVVMLERFLPDGAKQAGIYASAYRLLDAVNILGLLFANLALPMFSQMRREKKDMLPLLKLGVQIILFIAVSFTAAVVVHRHFIMHALYTEANTQSENVLGLLMMSFIAFCLSYVISTYLNAMRLTKRANIVYAMALVLSVTANVLIIPRFKSEGTAFVTLITQFFVLLALWYFAWQHLKPKSQLGWFVKLLVFCVCAFGIQWWVNYYWGNSVFIRRPLQMFLGGFICSLLAAALDIIPVREIFNRIYKKEL